MHIPEYVAAVVFDIRLHDSAAHKDSDGCFLSGPLKDAAVNIKWYGKQEGLLDLAQDAETGYYLVFTGPKAPAVSSRGRTRPWTIERVFLFDRRELLERLDERGVRIGVATSVADALWLATTVIRRHVMLQFQHHDRASLLAGKLHALLQRPYVKGRDVYDLLWFLGDPAWPPPNLVMLNNALQQTGWTGASLAEETWRTAVCARLQGAAWDQVVADVRPFLEPSASLDLLTPGTLMHMLAQHGLRARS